MSTAWTLPTTLELELLTALTTRPRRWVRLAFPARVTFRNRPVEDVFESDASRLFITRRAPDAVDLTLDLAGGHLTRDQVEQIEEIRRLGVPVYVYPRWPGTTQYLWPLRRNCKGDPTDADYSCTLGADSSMYIIEDSSSRDVSLIQVDPSSPLVMSGVYTGDHTYAAFPLGQGIGFLQEHTNAVKNSLFGAVTGNVPANWTAAVGTPGTDMGVLSNSWLGTPALWIWGQTAQWVSDTMTVAAAKLAAFSFGWKCDGEIKIKLNYDLGTDVTYTLGPGAGYEKYQVAVPAAASTVRIEVMLGSGSTYGEFSAPQFIGGNTEDREGSPYFLGSSGSGSTGRITACQARATGLDIEPHLTDDSGLICMSGIAQPCWADNVGPTYGLGTLVISRAENHSISAELSKFSTGLGMFARVRQNDVIKASSSIAHTLGSAYAWVLYSGYKLVIGTPTYYLGVKVAAVGTPAGTITTAETTSDVDAYLCFDQAWLGETYSNAQLDGILGGVCVHTLKYADLDSYVQMLGHRNYLDLWRNLQGRQYRLLPEMSPSPWERQYWGGTGQSIRLDLVQQREL